MMLFDRPLCAAQGCTYHAQYAALVVNAGSTDARQSPPVCAPHAQALSNAIKAQFPAARIFRAMFP